MAFVFKKTSDSEHNKFDVTNVEISTTHNEMTLSDLCEVFESFLLATGFVFDGNVDIVKDEGDEDYD